MTRGLDSEEINNPGTCLNLTISDTMLTTMVNNKYLAIDDKLAFHTATEQKVELK